MVHSFDFTYSYYSTTLHFTEAISNRCATVCHVRTIHFTIFFLYFILDYFILDYFIFHYVILFHQIFYFIFYLMILYQPSLLNILNKIILSIIEYDDRDMSVYIILYYVYILMYTVQYYYYVKS